MPNLLDGRMEADREPGDRPSGSALRPEPSVSIGLPVFNGEQFLEQSLDSILGQTYTDFELIISDNASTDRTESICRRYAERDARIRYHRQPQNRGVTWNFRQVALLACGGYFLWTAHDDRFAPEYIERCVAFLQKSPSTVLCYSKAIEIDEAGKQLARNERTLGADAPTPHQRFRELIRMEHNCESIFGIIRTDVLKKTSVHGDFPDSDRCVLAELALYGEFHELPDCLFFHREHTQRVTKQFPGRQERMFRLNPDRRLYLVFPHFRQFWEYLAAVQRAPLDWSERFRCHLQMLGWVWEYRSRLAADLKYVIARTFTPVVREYKRWRQV
jgi:glycosyltransferase involved in cell wall biosynthesis